MKADAAEKPLRPQGAARTAAPYRLRPSSFKVAREPPRSHQESGTCFLDLCFSPPVATSR